MIHLFTFNVWHEQAEGISIESNVYVKERNICVYRIKGEGQKDRLKGDKELER